MWSPTSSNVEPSRKPRLRTGPEVIANTPPLFLHVS